MSKKLIVGLAIAGSLIAGAAYAGDKATEEKAKPSASKSAKPAKQATTPTSSTASATMPADVVTNGPVPDTKENRAKYKPLSSLGRQTAARGN